MPVVRLRELATGREFWAINAHNAPNSRQRERDAAMLIEIEKVKELRAQGHPVFFFGDLNEKENALCKVTTQTVLVAASPTGNLTGCTGFRGMRLDWLFGSNVTFGGYSQARSPIIAKITDHAVVHARATVS
jgi:endonuclease/exonuclease/phosphatase family metal-dependent hydrolase